MKDREVHSAVAKWLSLVANVAVVKSHPGAARPSGAVLVLNFTGIAEVRDHAQGIEYTEAPTGDEGEDDPVPVKAAPLIETEWRFSLHAYGASPTDILRPVRAAAQLPQLNEPLMPGLVIFDVSQIRHVPDFQNERWEDRAQMDLFIRGVVKDGFVIDTIEEYSIGFERT